MDCLFRRGSTWYARLAIPRGLRARIGKTEFIASTRCRELGLAKIVASALLAGWRRQIADLNGIHTKTMELERLVAGHPALSAHGYLPLADAAQASGIDVTALLRAAAGGQLQLFYRQPGGIAGHMLPQEELAWANGPGESETIVPSTAQMPETAVHTIAYQPLRLRQPELMADLALTRSLGHVVLFDVPDKDGTCFAPEQAVELKQEYFEVKTLEIERMRSSLASRVTPQQLDLARVQREVAPAPAMKTSSKLQRRVSEAVEAFMLVREKQCSAEQARRIRGALELFVELEQDPVLAEVTADRMDRFRDELLPTVPANENKVRLQHGSTTITESIAAVRDRDWPRISPSEQTKRLTWIASMFDWLKKKEWIESDPCATLVEESGARSELRRSQERAQDAREIFTDGDLQRIFTGGTWFQTGRGTLTKANTYREFCPHYYWLPLLGLFTGARINELSQLHLKDFRCTPSGVWFLDIAVLDDDDEKKKRKNANSRRQIPLHPKLIELGILDWRNQLISNGFDRLFPELKFDLTKGYGKAATNWFGRYLKRLGIPRDNKKVFHSFRGTLITHCATKLKLTPQEISVISGHERDSSVLIKHYLKDQLPDDLIATVKRINFPLPQIAAFDSEAGLKAVSDALSRKNRGRGASED